MRSLFSGFNFLIYKMDQIIVPQTPTCRLEVNKELTSHLGSF